MPRTVGIMAADLKEQFTADRVLVVVDFLSSWAQGMQDKQDKREFRFVVDGLIRGLRDESLRLEIPFLVICSQARGNQGEDGWTAKESSGIDNAADTYMNLINDEKRPVPDNIRAIRLSLRKNRYGPVAYGDHAMKLDFHLEEGYMAEASR